MQQTITPQTKEELLNDLSELYAARANALQTEWDNLDQQYEKLLRTVIADYLEQLDKHEAIVVAGLILEDLAYTFANDFDIQYHGELMEGVVRLLVKHHIEELFCTNLESANTLACICLHKHHDVTTKPAIPQSKTYQSRDLTDVHSLLRKLSKNDLGQIDAMSIEIITNKLYGPVIWTLYLNDAEQIEDMPVIIWKHRLPTPSVAGNAEAKQSVTPNDIPGNII